MQIKKRYHSYPVLAPYTNDYEKSEFKIQSISYKKIGKKYRFELQLFLENPSIDKLINIDKAEYVIHVECSKTSFRDIYRRSLDKIEIDIDSFDLDGKVEFAPFIIAKKDIKNYENNLFHDDFNSFTFDIKKGQYLCIGNRGIVEIIKNKDELKQLSSIIRIAHVADMEKGTKVKLEGDRIQVLVASDLYSRYTYASRNKYRIRVLHSMIIFPALVHVLYELKDDSESNFEIYSERRWFHALKARFNELDMALDYNLFNEKSPYELAQIMLDYPVKDALDDMYESDQEES